jgi:aspartate racemase
VKTIGLLGGMSWESSVEYYRLVNQETRRRLGGAHSAPCVMWSVDFDPVTAWQEAGDWDTAGRELGALGAKVEAAGAELLVLCTNTMHRVAPQIQDAVSIPLLHIGDTTAAAVAAAGLDRIGLLGTRYTMEADFLRDHIAGHGIEVLVPPAADRDLVHDVIYSELVRGIVRDESRQGYEQVIGRLMHAGAQGVILGCTEIELLVDPDAGPMPLFPTTRLHAEAAVEAALA